MSTDEPTTPAANAQTPFQPSYEPQPATMASVSPFARSPSLGGSFMDSGRMNFTQNVSRELLRVFLNPMSGMLMRGLIMIL